MDNTSNDTDCIFPDSPRHTIVYIMSAIAIVSALCCVAAIILLIYKKLYEAFKYRLMCHLLLSVTVYSIVLIFELVTVNFDYDNTSQVQSCEVVGFLLQCTSWIQFLFHCAFVIYVIAGLYRSMQKRKLYIIPNDYENGNFGKWDIVLIILWFVPFLYSWIPFVHDTYGLAGAWCWIRIQDKDCNTYVAGIVEQFVLYYVFFAIFSCVNTIMIIIFLIAYAIRRYRKYNVNKEATGKIKATPTSPEEQTAEDKMKIPEGISLIPYLTIYQLLAYVNLVNRLYRAVPSDHNHTNAYGLWVAQALALSSYGFFASIYFFVLFLLKYYHNRDEDVEQKSSSYVKPNAAGCITTLDVRPQHEPENDHEEPIPEITEDAT